MPNPLPSERAVRARLAALLLAALLLAAAPALWACSGPETRVDPETQLQLHRELALRWYQMGELDRAEDQAVKGLALEPGDRQFRLLIGWIRQRRGGVEDVLVAEQMFRELAEEGDYRASLGLAGALERKGLSFEEASAGVASGERTTSAPDPAARAAELHQEALSTWRESIEAYEQTLAQSPDNARALSGLQRVYSQLGEYEQSLLASEQHRTVVGRELEFHRRQLQVPALNADEEAALRRNVEKEEAALVANDLHAVPMLLALRRPEEALARAAEVVELEPDNASAHALRAQALVDLERWAEAEESLDRFLANSTGLEFDHPDIQKAYALRKQCVLARAQP